MADGALSQALQFLSNASNETIAACLVALAAATYVILGRVGLVLIGVVLGIVVHGAWLSGSNDVDIEQKNGERVRRKEAGLYVLKKLLNRPGKEEEENNEEVDFQEAKALNFSDFQPETSSALSSLVDAIIRDYVRYWYTPLLPTDDTFPSSSKQSLILYLRALSTRLSRKRPADLFVNFFTNATSVFVVFFSELSQSISAADISGDVVVEEAVQDYLQKNPGSSFAILLDHDQQRGKLEAAAVDMLQFADPIALKYSPFQTFLRKILSGVVFETVLNTCAKAEWINGWIIYLFEEVDSELLNAIDAGVGGAAEKAVPGIELVSEAVPSLQSEDAPAKSPMHQRNVSKADVATQEAMEEMKRMNELIAREEASRSTASMEEPSSGYPTDTIATPTSSQDDLQKSVHSLASSQPEHGSATIDADSASTAQDQRTAFTSFDQLVPGVTVNPLHGAKITIFDDAIPGEKALVKNKPTIDYLIQIEPASSQQPGWMIPRKYSDFETLHEVLRRISVISGVPEFTQKYSLLPSWKGQTKDAIRNRLENYLQDAVSHSPLAECEGMKRFLDRDNQGNSKGSGKNAFGFPSPEAFQTMGKGMLDVLVAAPKGAAGGGKALIDGVSGVFTSVPFGAKKGVVSPQRLNRGGSSISLSRAEEESERPPLPKRPIEEPARSSGEAVRDPQMHLPPPPSEVSDDYEWPKREVVDPPSSIEFTRPSDFTIGSDNAGEEVMRDPDPPPEPNINPEAPMKRLRALHKDFPPLNEPETTLSVELFFALISELYTLSSAWNIRRAILNAARNYLLRPGNPNLESIRVLIQDTLIDANTSDSALAAYILKIRQNAVPTEEETAKWPAPPTEAQKEVQRVKARKLLLQKGMPQALTSIMGAAATGEALGRVFDALQIEEVARGLIFAMVLQAIRVMTH